MDLLPSEIWYLILGQVEFQARVVCSSWLEIIDAHPNFVKYLDTIERINKLPNTIRELSRRSDLLLANFNAALYHDGYGYADTKLGDGEINISSRRGNDYLRLRYENGDIDIEYDEHGEFKIYTEFAKDILKQYIDIDIKLSFLLKSIYFPEAKNVYVHPSYKITVEYSYGIFVNMDLFVSSYERVERPMKNDYMGRLFNDLGWIWSPQRIE